jgi:hypothetical protein
MDYNFDSQTSCSIYRQLSSSLFTLPPIYYDEGRNSHLLNVERINIQKNQVSQVTNNFIWNFAFCFLIKITFIEDWIRRQAIQDRWNLWINSTTWISFCITLLHQFLGSSSAECEQSRKLLSSFKTFYYNRYALLRAVSHWSKRYSISIDKHSNQSLKF